MATEFYGLFDSTTGDQRSYSADELATVFRALAGTGAAGGLAVGETGTGLSTVVSPGLAMIKGYVYSLADDGGAAKILQHQASDASPRIDRVVLKLNTNDRTITMYVKKGTAAVSPVAPTLTRSGGVYEISLAKVAIRAGAESIEASDVTDERSSEDVCGACVPEALKRSVLDARYNALATATAPGKMSANQYKQLAALVAALTVNSTKVDIGGRYLDNALFR